MNADDIRYYLYKAGFTHKLKHMGKEKYVRIACPFAPWTHQNKRDQHDAFGVEVKPDGSSFYHCFSCKQHGEFWQLFKTMTIHMKDERDKLNAIGNEVYKEDVMDMVSGRTARAVQSYEHDIEDFEEDDVMPDLTPMRFQYGTFEKEHEYIDGYLKHRGIKPELAKTFDLRYDDLKERIVIPCYSPSHDFCGMVGRALDPNDQVQKVYNYFGTRTDFGFGRVINDDLDSYKKLIVVEGMFDLIKTYQNLQELNLQKEIGVVCVFKSILSEYQAEWLEDLDKSVYIFFDSDAAGDLGAKQASKLLKGRLPRLTRISTNDKSVDAGDIDSKFLAKLLRLKA